MFAGNVGQGEVNQQNKSQKKDEMDEMQAKIDALKNI